MRKAASVPGPTLEVALKSNRLVPYQLPLLPALAMVQRLCFAALAPLLVACTPFAPQSLEGAEFLSRAQTQETDGVRVSVVALTPEESRRYFGEDLNGRDAVSYTHLTLPTICSV